jgi:hypothetical protein
LWLTRKKVLDTLIIIGILITGGAMAILPILKDPIDRGKQSKWLINKFNWVAYTVIGLFILGIILGVCKDTRDRETINRQRIQDSTQTASQIHEIKTADSLQAEITRKSDSTQLAQARDSIIYTEKGGIAKLKQSEDSFKMSTQRHLDARGKINLIKRLNKLIAENRLDKNTPIEFGHEMGNEESRIYAGENADFLRTKGFNVVSYLSPIIQQGKGYFMIFNQGKIFIEVGVLSQHDYP